MIVYQSAVHDPESRRLAKDLQDSGLTLVVSPDVAYDIQIIPLTSETLMTFDASHLAGTDKPVIPVLLSGTAPDNLPQPWFDLSNDYNHRYQDLLKALTIPHANPYPALLPFQEIDAPSFGGRSAFVQKLYRHISEHGRLIALIGPSGSGKTSSINAGLIPFLRNSLQRWVPIHVSVSDQPVVQIAAALQSQVGGESPLNRLYSRPDVLGELLDDVAVRVGRPLLILDDFENLFTRTPVTDRVYLLEILHHAINRDLGQYAICLVLSDDFEKRLLEYPQWSGPLEANHFDVPRLTQGELLEIIRQPAQAAGFEVEPTLIERMLADAGALAKTRVQILPLLSFTLWRLWEEQSFTLESYLKVGTLSGAVAQFAEQVWESLPPMRQLFVRQALPQLLDFGENTEPTARTLERSQLAFSWVSPEEIDTTLADLTAAGIIIQDINPVTQEHLLRLSHVALLKTWPRFTGWIDADAHNLRYGSQLERTAMLWASGEYSGQMLLRGAALDEASVWVNDPNHLSSTLLQGFIAVSSELRQSHETQERRQTRLNSLGVRALVGALVVALAVIIVGVVVTVRLNGDRNAIATRQAESTRQVATFVVENAALVGTLDAVATARSEAEDQIATLSDQYAQAATAQSAAETAQAQAAATANAISTEAVATVDALIAERDANAAAIANVQNLQSTLDAVAQAEQALRFSLASNLAETARNQITTNPMLALRLAAVAGSVAAEVGQGDAPQIDSVIRDALKANTVAKLVEGTQQIWPVYNNQYVVMDYPDKTDELWRISPAEKIADFNGSLEQILRVANGQTFLVDYVEPEIPDEVWRINEDGIQVQQFEGEIAPPSNEFVITPIPNYAALENGNYFVVKFDGDRPGEIWESATLTRVVVLKQDFEHVVQLADGLVFVRFADHSGLIYETSSGIEVLDANDVITEQYDNNIFIRRRAGEFDEIWLTTPFAALTSVTGRAQSATQLYGTPYFVVQYEGGRAAEIWQQEPEVALVYTFSGEIDISTTYNAGQYFFVRYSDRHASELWGTNPLQVLASLNGHLDRMNMDMVLGEEEVVVEYEDNTISELWSLETTARLAPLHGHVLKVVPLLGDIAFAVSYDGAQPAEIWSSINGSLIARLGTGGHPVTDIRALQDGAYVIVFYEDVPAEIWAVGTEGAELAFTLPDITLNFFTIRGGDYFAVNYTTLPAQIWELGASAPLIQLTASIAQVSYNADTGYFSYSTTDGQVYTVDFETIQGLSNPETPLTGADLMGLACAHFEAGTPVINDTVLPYLGGLNPTVCAEPPQ